MILFRADGNKKIGSGHIMRCLSIADAFKRAGEEVSFVLADENFREYIISRGHSAVVLGTAYDDMPGELDKISVLIKKLKPGLIFIDSYYVTAEYLSVLNKLASTAYIDDIAAFAYPADVLINYNIYGGDIGYERLYSEAGEKLPLLMLGASYAPLRAEFRDIPRRTINEKCRDVLISTGGADPVHLALKMAGYLSTECSDDGLVFHLLIGAMNQDRAEIERISASAKNIRLHCSVSDMRSLITSCDIAVSAAGSTLYEVCACGTPLVTYVLADNQIQGAKAFERLGLAVSCGDVRGTDACGRIADAVKSLADAPARRREMSEKMQQYIDGGGADRIARTLMDKISGH